MSQIAFSTIIAAVLAMRGACDTAFLGKSEDQLQKSAGEALVRMMPSTSLRASLTQSCRSCYQNATQRCALSDMSSDATCVYPGLPAQCMDGPFAFRVTPGNTSKLLFFFEGGGACVNKEMEALHLCTEDLETGGLYADQGIFNRSKVDNPFQDYTVVNVAYCSGDIFIANASSELGNQFGYSNALSAVTWAHENLAGKLTSLVITGDSAGAVGSQIWARYMLNLFEYEQASVLADSFVGIFPDGALPPLQTWNSCGLPLWSPEMRAECEAKTITIPQNYLNTISEFPCVRFASIQSKADEVQRVFYCLMENSTLEGLACVEAVKHHISTGAKFFYDVNIALEKLNKQPNWVVYFVDGTNHTFFELPRFYNTVSSGVGKIQGARDLELSRWVAAVVHGNATSSWDASSQCYGDLREPASSAGIAYCDTNLFPKYLKAGQQCATSFV